MRHALASLLLITCACAADPYGEGAEFDSEKITGDPYDRGKNRVVDKIELDLNPGDNGLTNETKCLEYETEAVCVTNVALTRSGNLTYTVQEPEAGTTPPTDVLMHARVDYDFTSCGNEEYQTLVWLTTLPGDHSLQLDTRMTLAATCLGITYNAYNAELEEVDSFVMLR